MTTFDGMPSMLSVEEAQEKIMSMFAPLEPESKPILESVGQVLAEDITSGINIPPLDNSAMDGYAIRYQDVQNASSADPTNLHLIGHIAAGQLPDQVVTQGTAIRIMTGAPIPDGANAVVPFEDTDEFDNRANGISVENMSNVEVRVSLPKGTNIRPKGQDIVQGELVLAKGSLIRPSEVGVLASLGRNTVNVIRKPIIAVISTGNELLEPGEPIVPGKIYDSNSYSVCSSILVYGGIPKFLGIAQDSLDSLNAKLEEALAADLIITTAGVSRGDFDIVKDLLAKRGKITFWTVRMRPAKPLAFGIFPRANGENIPHIGLPGNPVSTLVAFEELVRPAILTMLGKQILEKSVVRAILIGDIVNYDERRVYARVTVTKKNHTYYATLTGDQGSGILTSMTKANGLAICPEDVPLMKSGEMVEVQMLDWPEGISGDF